jgi:hypothetical protein
VVVADEFRTIRRVVECLCKQEIADRIELVVATPQPSAFEIPERVCAALAGVQVVPGEIDTLPQARAAAIRAARAPVVVFGETHSFPEAGWAQALLETHRGSWTAVGPTIVNANPESAIAWSNLLLDYGPFVECEQRGEVPRLMGHNSAYKREDLVAYGSRLDTLLLSDEVLNDDLRARGRTFFLEPGARTRHLNVSRRRPWLTERFAAGRVFAAERSKDWPSWKRLVYAGGSPLIPVIRLRRVLRDVRRLNTPRRGFLAWVLPPLAVGLTASAVGEFCGYASGAGERDRRRLYEIEVFRGRFVAASWDGDAEGPVPGES